jgi:hypothetical protein
LVDTIWQSGSERRLCCLSSIMEVVYLWADRTLRRTSPCLYDDVILHESMCLLVAGRNEAQRGEIVTMKSGDLSSYCIGKMCSASEGRVMPYVVFS